MKAYWDSSALVEATADATLMERLRREKGITRIHALAEVFSALTRNQAVRTDADSAAASVADLAKELEFEDLTVSDVVNALKTARSKGVRGGRVHDLLHAVAADKSKATELLTLDRNDFEGLTDRIEVVNL